MAQKTRDPLEFSTELSASTSIQERRGVSGALCHPIRRDPWLPHQDGTHDHPIRMGPMTTPSGRDPQPPHQDGTHDHPIRAGPVTSLSCGWVYREGNNVWLWQMDPGSGQGALSKPRNTIPVSVFIPQSLIIFK